MPQQTVHPAEKPFLPCLSPRKARRRRRGAQGRGSQDLQSDLVNRGDATACFYSSHDGDCPQDLLNNDSTLSSRRDFTGSVLGIGIKFISRTSQNSHADSYVAEHINTSQQYEVKVFSKCVKSPKQNRYQKRAITRSIKQKSYLRSWALDTYVFLFFFPRHDVFSTNSKNYGALLSNLSKNLFPQNVPSRFTTKDSTEALTVAMQLQIEKVADVDAKDDKRPTVLYKATRRGRCKLVSLPQRKGADINIMGDKGCTALQKSADIKAKHDHGRTALHSAIKSGGEDVVLLLLQKGADINAKDDKGRTALHWAAINGEEAVALVLLQNGADINAKDYHGRTALHSAASNGNEALVLLLLEEGANLKARDRTGQTALYKAAYIGHDTVIQLLLKKGANVNTKGGYCNTALSAAAACGREEAVRLLLQNGANIHSEGSHYGTALQAAADRGSEAIVRLLLENGANVNSGGGYVGTALQAAAWEGHKSIVRLLLQNGADVNAKGGSYGSAIQAAMRRCHEAIMQLLLQNGAEVNDRGDS